MLSQLRSAATHSGRFHGDDVLAAALLRAALPALPIVRTRNPDEFSRHSVLIDVGGLHDPDTWRLDHHFSPPPRRTDGTALSSVGLLFQLAGPRLLQLAGAGSAVVARLAMLFEHAVVRVVDAHDTGSIHLGATPKWVGALTAERPQWDELPWNSDGWGRALDDAFERQITCVASAIRRLCERATPAVELQAVVAAFTRELQADAVPARARERAAIERARRVLVQLLREHVDPKCPLEIPSPLMPWTRVWESAERESGRSVDQVVWRDVEGRWRLQSAWMPGTRSGARVPLPLAWAGLSEHALIAASEIDDAIFCHPGRFVAGFGSRASAFRAAELAWLAHKNIMVVEA